ncbi:von Willebrand domain protein [Fusarium austroafricanum]|uniref:von Willebrand domain protein n=1 Tax=Fusarium austroafricanum TaxID=2364996 RepID=A0A8H4JH07_9HYPO|nr:von Willebrand domain protein [Fusarium austroafricanum]
MAYVGPAQRRQGVYCHEHWEPVGYPLLSSRYDYMVRDVFVEATLTETYQAQTNVEREVSYIFEVPPEASVIGFSAQVGSTKVDAIVEEKSKANNMYQKAKDAGVQAWKLDKVNDEVFQISLGNAAPNSTIIVSVDYAYVISSDTIEDSVRLTIPAGLAPRPGAGLASQATIPTAPTGANAVTITGFSDNSSEHMTPREKRDVKEDWKAYVTFESRQFISKHFVLAWTVDDIDQGRCQVERLHTTGSQTPTYAFALTLVSNIDLDLEEHEYIFLVDNSGSMSGQRTQNANGVVRAMLDQLPSYKRSTFNIYNFNDPASSILPGKRSLNLDTDNVAMALNQLKASAYGGTDIDKALKTVFSERDSSKPRCSVIVITDGLDWGVTAAMKTVQQNAANAAANSKLLRVFVVGLGDDVSRGMCEALARAGSGATAYMTESELYDDYQTQKAQTLINAINRAPIRVRSIDWGMKPDQPRTTGGASGQNLGSRRQPNQNELGAKPKGSNVGPPNPLQQAPKPGTMFWVVRSYWYAIISGTFKPNFEARITYEVPGHTRPMTLEVKYGSTITIGRVIHTLAARALIQTLEDKIASMTESDNYWSEAEIVSLGKAYSLASTQTSFVATMDGTGVRTNVPGSSLASNQRLLSSVSHTNQSDLGFVATQAPAGPSGGAPVARYALASATSGRSVVPMTTMKMAVSGTSFDTSQDNEAWPGDEGSSDDDEAREDDLSELVNAQEGNGSFDPRIIQSVIFPSTGIPEVPAFISTLSGRENIKEQIWLAICVIAYFQNKHAERSGEWGSARSKAEKFVKTTLCCIFGVDSSQCESILTNSLDDAEGYFY